MFPRILVALALALPLVGSVPQVPAADTPSVEIGGDVRVRGYALENMWDLDAADDGDRWSVWRNRARLFARIDLPRDVGAYLRLANQHWGAGVTGSEGADRWEADNKSAKLFVDEAWLELHAAFGLPLDLRLGRQTVVRGSGFVLCDGQSQLASTANYLDGARLAWRPAHGLTAELLHFKDEEHARADAARDDVTLTGLYLTYRAECCGYTRELYALRRHDQGLDKDTVLYGARLSGEYGALDYDLEGGLQRGDLAADVPHEAWGLTCEAGVSPAGAPAGLRLFAGFTGLSGDDPDTDAWERWDSFYGGWPRYGDLLAWTYINLGAGNAVSGFDPGYAALSSQPGEVVYGNLLMTTFGLNAAPTTDLSLRASWTALRAHRTAGDDDIGDYWQLSARYRYADGVSLAIYAARLHPGAAYGPDAAAAHEYFWETTLSF